MQICLKKDMLPIFILKLILTNLTFRRYFIAFLVSIGKSIYENIGFILLKNVC